MVGRRKSDTLMVICRPFFMPIPVDRGTHFLSFICPVDTHGILVFLMEYLQYSFYFHFPLLFFFDFDSILHDSDHNKYRGGTTIRRTDGRMDKPSYRDARMHPKMKINVLWEMPVAASLFRVPQTFRAMDRRSHTNKSL